MIQPVRKYSFGGKYRYGFNGKENDNEVSGKGNNIDFGARIYDSRIARWLSVDPLQKKYPGETPYLFTGGNPIYFKDLDGRDRIVTVTVNLADGTSIQQERVYKSEKDFTYHKDTKFNGGYDYYKKDIIVNISINLPETGITWQEAMKNPDNVISSEEHPANWYDIGPVEYYWNLFTGFVPSVGDESGKVIADRWRVYGNGKNSDWQSGLPTAGANSESIDLIGLLEITPGFKPDMVEEILTSEKIKKLKNAVDIINTVATETYKASEVVDKKMEQSLTLPPGSDSCTYCNDVEPKGEMNQHGDVNKDRHSNVVPTTSPNRATNN